MLTCTSYSSTSQKHSILLTDPVCGLFLWRLAAAEKLMNIIRSFHDGMFASVLENGLASNTFHVTFVTGTAPVLHILLSYAIRCVQGLRHRLSTGCFSQAAFITKLLSTWWTTAFPSLMSPVDDICIPPVVICDGVTYLRFCCETNYSLVCYFYAAISLILSRWVY